MKRRQHGVTLIELLIVVVVISILAAIAIPSYRRYVIRANRTSGKVLLMQTAQALERCYTNSTPYAYNSATCVASVTLPITSPDGTYTVGFTAATPPTVNTYALTATPQGTQAQDSQCANFSLNQAGTQTVSGTLSVAECWRK
ncbi:MAG TPA: type IV pilin protein [Steroidobacteraceae bacterium]|nr:type IV pilin protein [Steroidobacteraceae bacterium]